MSDSIAKQIIHEVVVETPKALIKEVGKQAKEAGKTAVGSLTGLNVKQAEGKDQAYKTAGLRKARAELFQQQRREEEGVQQRASQEIQTRQQEQAQGEVLQAQQIEQSQKNQPTPVPQGVRKIPTLGLFLKEKAKKKQ